jgi:hypothetical protein
MITSCSAVKPPLELAPKAKIVEKAIALELQHTYQKLTHQLDSQYPQLQIKQIQVSKIEPLLIANLATYHLKGTYQMKLKLSSQTVEKKDNNFEIYLQRQREGKTWRLLRKTNSTNLEKWLSYPIPN